MVINSVYDNGSSIAISFPLENETPVWMPILGIPGN